MASLLEIGCVTGSDSLSVTFEWNSVFGKFKTFLEVLSIISSAISKLFSTNAIDLHVYALSFPQHAQYMKVHLHIIWFMCADHGTTFA